MLANFNAGMEDGFRSLNVDRRVSLLSVSLGFY